MKETLRQELDFEQEARNGEQCQEDLRHLSYVYVPQILWNMTSKVRLLVWSRKDEGITPTVCTLKHPSI